LALAVATAVLASASTVASVAPLHGRLLAAIRLALLPGFGAALLLGLARGVALRLPLGLLALPSLRPFAAVLAFGALLPFGPLGLVLGTMLGLGLAMRLPGGGLRRLALFVLGPPFGLALGSPLGAGLLPGGTFLGA
jgi:hypothetical protein